MEVAPFFPVFPRLVEGQREAIINEKLPDLSTLILS